MVAAAIQRRACTLEQLATEVGSCPRNGSAHLRTAVADVLAGARSAAEASAADRLRRARLPEFEMNVPLLSANGRVIAVLDFLWRGLLAVLEIDSREFHFREADWKATGARHNLLTRLGLALTHYPPSETSSPRWTDEVQEWLRNRAAELRTPYRAATPTGEGSPLRLPLVRQHLAQQPGLA